jgi:hypothetical protein
VRIPIPSFNDSINSAPEAREIAFGPEKYGAAMLSGGIDLGANKKGWSNADNELTKDLIITKLMRCNVKELDLSNLTKIPIYRDCFRQNKRLGLQFRLKIFLLYSDHQSDILK